MYKLVSVWSKDDGTSIRCAETSPNTYEFCDRIRTWEIRAIADKKGYHDKLHNPVNGFIGLFWDIEEIPLCPYCNSEKDGDDKYICGTHINQYGEMKQTDKCANLSKKK